MWAPESASRLSGAITRSAGVKLSESPTRRTPSADADHRRRLDKQRRFVIENLSGSDRVAEREFCGLWSGIGGKSDLCGWHDPAVGDDGAIRKPEQAMFCDRSDSFEREGAKQAASHGIRVVCRRQGRLRRGWWCEARRGEERLGQS